ncbi:hypothetical protein RF11_01579 [Thelohanellus kitauei]|uniref:Tc1-like transposase DDE domain-containing protein n=1 Tax=Thelohanellus kitauei TaxID=669202 RepID=A0A0C2JM51_THEKT|nr:hypothetical protein RF11_01579 [Thelohanellus kitauei]
MYMDETGFNFDIRRSYGLSQRVQPRNRTLTNSRGRNIKVNAALNVTGIIHYWYNEPRITKPTNIISFSQDFCHGKCPFHHSIVCHAFESRGHRIVFFTPYSQKLNAIELLLSKRKSYF